MNDKASADCQEERPGHLPILGQPKATLWVVAFQEEKKGGVFIEHSREKGCRLHPGLGLARWYCSARVSKTLWAAREQCHSLHKGQGTWEPWFQKCPEVYRHRGWEVLKLFGYDFLA